MKYTMSSRLLPLQLPHSNEGSHLGTTCNAVQCSSLQKGHFGTSLSLVQYKCPIETVQVITPWWSMKAYR